MAMEDAKFVCRVIIRAIPVTADRAEDSIIIAEIET